jgi:hypothetical protein
MRMMDAYDFAIDRTIKSTRHALLHHLENPSIRIQSTLNPNPVALCPFPAHRVCKRDSQFKGCHIMDVTLTMGLTNGAGSQHQGVPTFSVGVT